MSLSRPVEYRPNELSVVNLLTHGASTAISIREIRRIVQIPPREVKRAVRGLRLRHNIPVCSSRGEKPGYFLADTPDELMRTYQMLKSEGIANLRAALSLPGRRNQRLRRMLGQLELELKK